MKNLELKSAYFMEIKKCNYDALHGVAEFILQDEEKEIILRFTNVSKYMFIQSSSHFFDNTIKFFPIEDVIEKDSSNAKEFQLIEKKHKKVLEEFQYNYIIDSCVSTWYINAENIELLENSSFIY